MKLVSSLWLMLAIRITLGGSVLGATPLTPAEGQVWRYQLLHGSWYLDDCPPCARPTWLQALRGSFSFTPGRSDPLFSRYELRDIALTVGGVGEGSIRLEGSGELEVGGEVALTHRLTLRLKVTTPGGSENVVFESGLQPGEPDWPWLAITVSEVDPSPVRILSLTLDAMPLRDLWFSTVAGFTAEHPGPNPTPVSAAEVLSDHGNIVVPEEEIRSALQLESSEQPLNLDALTVAPGGVVELSLKEDAKSLQLETIHHGDLVSLAGERVKSYSEFGSAIGPEPPTPDLGLDAVEWIGDGSFLFSTQEPVFSEVLGETVGRGDLMSTSGQRLRTNTELLRAFKPLHPERDYGLDAVVVWPTGEIWFSTEEAVELDGFLMLSDGDLLSDRGRVIYRNLEMLQRFGPLEDAANFGLDAVVIVTDVQAVNVPPKLKTIQVSNAGSEVELTWEGKGRFFQVEESSQLEGPYLPAGPIVAAQREVIPLGGSAAFYQIRQW